MKRLFEYRLTRTRRQVAMEEIAPYDVKSIAMAEHVAEVVRRLVGDSPREHFYAFYLDAKNRIIGFELLAIGGQAEVEIRLAELLRSALVSGAIGVIVSHNHPSGDLSPSEADRELTRRIVAGCQAVGIRLLDHVITTDGGCFSFAPLVG